MDENQSPPSLEKLMRSTDTRKIISIAVYLILPPMLLFGGAGTLKWGMGWLYLFLTMGSVIISRVLVARVHPDLLEERSSSMGARDVPAWDRKIVPFISTIVPLAIMLSAGLDKRFGWSPPFSAWIVLLGTLLIVAAVTLAIWAMVTNRYFSAYVRIQHERNQKVVKSGPYAIIRHPGYAGGILTNIGVPLMLGSLWSMIPSIIGIVFISFRTELEDRYLRQELAGYKAYTQKVRWKIFPGIW